MRSRVEVCCSRRLPQRRQSEVCSSWSVDFPPDISVSRSTVPSRKRFTSGPYRSGGSNRDNLAQGRESGGGGNQFCYEKRKPGHSFLAIRLNRQVFRPNSGPGTPLPCLPLRYENRTTCGGGAVLAESRGAGAPHTRQAQPRGLDWPLYRPAIGPLSDGAAN